MDLAEFERRIAQMADSPDPQKREDIRRAIWDDFGRDGAVFITDMASFSSTVRYKGITYFLAMIHRSRKILRRVIESHHGVILKFETDNCFAFFEDAADAIRAGLEVMDAHRTDNTARPADEHVHLGIGIDFGNLLLIGEEDYFGDPVNTASKLGEDIADNRELFVTERALKESGLELPGLVHKTRMISDIEIRYAEVPVSKG